MPAVGWFVKTILDWFWGGGVWHAVTTLPAAIFFSLQGIILLFQPTVIPPHASAAWDTNSYLGVLYLPASPDSWLLYRDLMTAHLLMVVWFMGIL